LPSPGDEVEVIWGLETVRGHVVDAYRGVRPRVVVEIDAGEVDSEATTVTVPPSALEPGAAADSPWARAARYEKSVSHALSEILGKRLKSMESGIRVDDAEVDLLARLSDGRVIVIELKHRTKRLPASEIRGALTRLQRLLIRRPTWLGLLVTNQEVPQSFNTAMASRIAAVEWKDAKDDDRLARVVTDLLGS
jgi:hypothetical protein